MQGDDGVWRNSPFAGHADDVTLMRPPGGSVSYEVPARETAGGDAGLSGRDLKLRDRARAVLDGRARAVAEGARRDALERALDAGVLDDAEVADARAWLARRRR